MSNRKKGDELAEGFHGLPDPYSPKALWGMRSFNHCNPASLGFGLSDAPYWASRLDGSPLQVWFLT